MECRQACPGWIYPFANHPKFTEVRSPIDADLSKVRVVRTDYTWKQPRWMAHAVYTVEADRYVQKTYEGAPTSTDLVHAAKVHENGDLKRTIENWFVFNDYGNAVQAHETRTDGAETVTTRTFRNFRNLAGDYYHVGLLLREEVQREGKGANLRKVVRQFDYDERGRAKYAAIQKDLADQQVEISVQRNGNGTIRRITSSAPNAVSRAKEYSYDDAGVFVRSVRDLTSNHLALAGIHPALGVPVIAIEPNGAETRSKYDFTGRLRSSTTPAAPDTTVRYGREDYLESLGGAADELDIDFVGPTIVRATSNDGAETIQAFDARGRLRRTYTKRSDGRRTREDLEYNTLGQLTEQSLPFDDQATPDGFTVVERDLLGRPTKVTNPDGSSRTAQYLGLQRIDSTDESGKRSSERMDVDDLVKEVVQLDGTREVKTAYAYHPFGHLRSITMPSGATTTYEVDDLGRRTKSTDPDAGVELQYYDGFGAPRETRFGGRPEDNGNLLYTTTYEHDHVGRPTKVTTTCNTPSACRNEERRFTWDAAPHAAGRLVRAESVTDGIATTFEYGAQGTLEAEELFLDGRTFRTEMHYDQHARLDELTYPTVAGVAPLSVGHDYDATGLLSRIHGGDGSIYWEAQQRDQLNRVTRERQKYSGGVETAQRREFDPLTGRLTLADTLQGSQVKQRFELNRPGFPGDCFS